MSDLWFEASADHEGMAREAALARADADLEAVMPFLLAARSEAEYFHRSALAEESIVSIAARHGIDESDLMATAERRYRLYREALTEGQEAITALEPLLQGGGYGSGPANGYEHDEGPDFAGDYAEVPQGAPGGPDPAVVRPRPPMTGQVTEATGMRRRADSTPQTSMTPAYMPMPADTGTGSGSVDMGVQNSAGMTSSLPAGLTSNGDDTVPLTPNSIGQVTSAVKDPVLRKVTAVQSAIAAVNPQLPAEECARVARLVVGRYLRHADLSGSVMGDAPVESGGGSGDSGGGMSGTEEFMLGRGLIKAAPEMLAAL